MTEIEKTLLLSIGLSEQKVAETLKNKLLTKTLIGIIHHVMQNFPDVVLKSIGKLLYLAACHFKKQIIVDYLPLLIDDISLGKINSEIKLNAAIDYLIKYPEKPVNIEKFESSYGAKVNVKPEQIEKTVECVLEKYQNSLLEQRYKFNFNILIAEVRKQLKWAEGKSIKHEIDFQVLNLLGPRSDKDCTKNENNKITLQSCKHNTLKELGAESITELMRTKVFFHAPGQNHVTDGYIVTPYTTLLLKEHLKLTGGCVRTRFPPEPNGILHIGHAKAININFGYAQVHNGVCLLRYDDTNPEKEVKEFFQSILDIVNWLGYYPNKITYSSDYFDQLYELAHQLIAENLAYVCHQKQEMIQGFNPLPSPWRNRDPKENDMKNGVFAEGEATLRLKITLEEGKQDPVAYRIKYIPHTRTANRWCIYPTYDYTHALCDSLEHITHSLCTKEFQSRRSSYYWLCNALRMYCPVQWEYGRLNIDYTVISKRKISQLIKIGIVSGWDDPRLFTLTALRRRGFPPEAINNFCAKLGLTTAQTSVSSTLLESCVRNILNKTAPRAMAVLNPLQIYITNFESSEPMCFTVDNIPNDCGRGSHTILLKNILYIDDTDFREDGDYDFRRLTLNQPVGLNHTGLVIYVENLIRNTEGKVLRLNVRYENLKENNKPKAFIHWVSDYNICEIRLYSNLFFHKNPEDINELSKDFISDCNPNSLIVIKNAYVDKFIESGSIYNVYQFERVGFFCIDPDSTPRKMILNRTVTLKESASKMKMIC